LYGKGKKVKHFNKRTGLGLIAVLLATTTASATTDQFTHVASVRTAISTGSVGIIEMTENSLSKPACATFTQGGGAAGRWFAVDLSTDGGREALKVAQQALLAGKSVRITGSGTCTVNTNKEDLSAIYMFK
jgi:hypothetical protein